MPTERTKTVLNAVPPADNLIELDDVCQRCFGSGMEIVAGKGARMCECRGWNQHSNLYERARVPTRFLDSSFVNYNVLNAQGMVDPFLERAREKAINFVQEYPNVTKGLLFIGQVGVGKTHLAVSVIKGLIDRNHSSCLFYEFNWLLKEIQDSYNPKTQGSELQLLSKVINVDVLVLDEIGASKPTDWVKDTLMNIISTRYNSRKPTIFTTNYMDEEYAVTDIDRNYVEDALLRQEGNLQRKELLKDRMKTLTLQEWDQLIEKERLKILVANESLQERIGLRLRSRMYEMCDEIFIKGSDYRRRSRTGSRINKS